MERDDGVRREGVLSQSHPAAPSHTVWKLIGGEGLAGAEAR